VVALAAHLEVQVVFQVELVDSLEELTRTCSQAEDVAVVRHLRHQEAVAEVDLAWKKLTKKI
jgi:hypothetical protein